MGTLELAIPAFIAGLLMFFAPCTLPLVPGYLGFISGVSLGDAGKSSRLRRRIFVNGLLYVIGFSAVFIALGSIVGLGGQAIAVHRELLGRIGGLFIVLFGLFMMRVFSLPYLEVEKHIPFTRTLKPGTPLSSLLFGATFALGWTPCVGPILGAVFVLAATSATVGSGALLLAIFSLGLAIPFLGIAALIGWASEHMAQFAVKTRWISYVGGAFLVFLGVLLMFNQLGILVGWFFRAFSFLNIEERLLDYV